MSDADLEQLTSLATVPVILAQLLDKKRLKPSPGRRRYIQKWHEIVSA